MKRVAASSLLVLNLFLANAWALDLDWSGQFRTEANWIHNYSLDSNDTASLRDPVRDGKGGYYVPGGGSRDAYFQNLFMRVRPKLIVNDNIYIKSEWWVEDPIFGFFGNGVPYTSDQRQFYSTQSRGSTITAQRFWAEFLSDVGTFQVGRAPLHWGLGIVWNSGDGLWDRYESTGDAIRLLAKFGSFSFVPSIIKYSQGNNIGGSCNASSISCTALTGGAGVSDYSLIFKYENPDEDFEGGVNFIKRIAGAAQDTDSGYLGYARVSEATQRGAGVNFNTWDLYGKKRLGKFTFSGEVPITTGDVAGAEYKTYAIALESNWNISDHWEADLKAGHAPGQGSITGDAPSRFRAFYFNPAYRLGFIMFNYQLANFAGPNTQNDPSVSASQLRSPYDNPIVNANYLNIGGAFKTEKWKFRTAWTFAKANEVAQTGQNFFNTWERKFYANGAGKNQENSLGWEMDYGTSFFWDETFQFHFDFGWYFPGGFYKFSNTTTDNPVSAVFGSMLRVGVAF